MAERRLERDLLARQGLNHPQPSSSSQHGKAALTAKRPAVERSEAREPSGTAPEARLVDSRSVSPTSSDSSGLFPRKRKRPRQSRTSSPIEGTTTKDGRHQRDEATLAGPTLGVDTGRVFGTQGRRRGDLAETLAGDYYSPAPDDVAESRESPEPDNSILGSKVSKPKSKKRKKPEAPESSTEGIQPQLDEVLSSSTPKPPKEKTLKILPIYEESDEMVAQLFLMQYVGHSDIHLKTLHGSCCQVPSAFRHEQISVEGCVPLGRDIFVSNIASRPIWLDCRWDGPKIICSSFLSAKLG